ncbi:MAG: type II toxin-antitoxin system HicA family toxin [Patescibacteria group bacterium]
MPKLPRISGMEMIRFLERQGFSLIRIRGSHHYLEKKELHISVPVHGNRSLNIGTLRSILRDIKMSPIDFAKHL